MSKTKKAPNLRFQGFTDDWEQRKLGEVVEITMGQSPSSKNYTENPNDHILVQGNADMKNGYVVPRVWTTQITKQAEKGDLILSVRAPVGDIGKTDYDVVLGRGVAAIKGNSFIFQLLTKMKINGYWTRFSTGSTFESINSDNIKNAQISIPSLREQEKIGGLFNEFDSLIALHQHKLDQLRVLKEILLQKLFANDQHDKPELRFKDFTDKWEKVKIGSLFTESTEKSATGQLLSVSINKGVYPFDETERKNNSSKNKSNYKFVEKYDIAYNSMRMWQGAEGVSYYSGIVSPAYTVLKPQQNSNPEFYAYMFKRAEMLNKFRRYSQGLTSDTWNLKFPILKTISLRTTDIKEQEKIVQLLRMVKDNISLQQKKLTQYQQAKKFLLQQMFI